MSDENKITGVYKFMISLLTSSHITKLWKNYKKNCDYKVTLLSMLIFFFSLYKLLLYIDSSFLF